MLVRIKPGQMCAAAWRFTSMPTKAVILLLTVSMCLADTLEQGAAQAETVPGIGETLPDEVRFENSNGEALVISEDADDVFTAWSLQQVFSVIP